jgi:hypothetical protein
MSVLAMFRPGMRAYLIPLIGGIALVVSVFLPWIVIDEVVLTGFPDVLALWVMGLGALAATLATLSMITRKNSRHPLFLIGLASLGIMFLSWRIMPSSVNRRVLSRVQAIAIVENTDPITPPQALVGSGIYLGLAAASAIVAFGFTIVVNRAARPYAVTDPNDDV